MSGYRMRLFTLLFLQFSTFSQVYAVRWTVKINLPDGTKVEKPVRGKKALKLFLPKTAWECFITPTVFNRQDKPWIYETKGISCKFGRYNAIASSPLAMLANGAEAKDSTSLQLVDKHGRFIIRLYGETKPSGKYNL